MFAVALMFLRQSLFEPVSLNISLGSICELDIVVNRELFTAGVTPKCAHFLGSRYRRRASSQLTFLNRDCSHRILNILVTRFLASANNEVVLHVW